MVALMLRFEATQTTPTGDNMNWQDIHPNLLRMSYEHILQLDQRFKRRFTTHSVTGDITMRYLGRKRSTSTTRRVKTRN